MTNKLSPTKSNLQALETRNVFLDTQVYRGVGFNIANPAMRQLKQHILSHRILLHTTDITMREVKRQIEELAADRERELARIEKHLRRWRRQAPRSTPAAVLDINGSKIAAELMASFSNFLHQDCSATLHDASKADAVAVFEKYFNRAAPFDGEKSKEFPDAFVAEALGAWAASGGHHIYVVTQDEAFSRAAEDHPNLIPLKTINDVISRAGVAFGQAVETTAEIALNAPDFNGSLELAIGKQLENVTFSYVGDLNEGEAHEGRLTSIEAVEDWSVVGISPQRTSILLTALCNVEVEIDYYDDTFAHYDREDRRWYGLEAAEMEISDTVQIDLIADLNPASGEVIDAEFLSNEVKVREPRDD